MVEEDKKQEKKEVEEDEKKGESENDEPEDPPIVKELKVIDDKYLAVEREYEAAMKELQKKYTALQQPWLDKRSAVLQRVEDDNGPKSGTPAISGFWLTALKHHPALDETIEEWDEPVLEFLMDVKKGYVDEADIDVGFTLEFQFAENPYFTNTVIKKTYLTEEDSPYTGDINVTEIKSDAIEWKAGKNVTVESVKKKVKGGGAKKAKQKGKESEEPRDSFFRSFFRSLKAGEAVPDDVNLEGMDMDEEDMDEDTLLEYMMENDHEVGCAFRDQIIPYAVRWYTGEAAPEEDDADEDEESEEEDEDDDDSDEDEPPAKGGKKKGGAAKAPSKPAAGEKAEECKQQ